MPRRHQRCNVTLATIACLIASSGCTPEAHRYIKFPDLFHPGPAGYQRAEAVEHDPYPLDDIGPPVVGGRPLGYQAGVPEVERTRMNAPPPPGMRPVVVPGLPVAAPPVVMPYPTTPSYAAPSPVITTPYAPASPVQSAPFVQQRRSPY